MVSSEFRNSQRQSAEADLFLSGTGDFIGQLEKRWAGCSAKKAEAKEEGRRQLSVVLAWNSGNLLWTKDMTNENGKFRCRKSFLALLSLLREFEVDKSRLDLLYLAQLRLAGKIRYCEKRVTSKHQMLTRKLIGCTTRWRHAGGQYASSVRSGMALLI
jgi:hypothetical protein